MARVLAVAISATSVPERNWRRKRDRLLRSSSVKASCEPRMFPSPVGVPTERWGISWVENTTALLHPSIKSKLMPLLIISIKVSQSDTGRGSDGARLCVSR